MSNFDYCFACKFFYLHIRPGGSVLQRVSVLSIGGTHLMIQFVVSKLVSIGRVTV